MVFLGPPGTCKTHHLSTGLGIRACQAGHRVAFGTAAQRGSNENMNGRLRDYFPKGTDLSAHPPGHLLAVENELNNRPRQVLGDRTPAELFAALLASESVCVATLTRTRPAATGPTLGRR